MCLLFSIFSNSKTACALGQELSGKEGGLCSVKCGGCRMLLLYVLSDEFN